MTGNIVLGGGRPNDEINPSTRPGPRHRESPIPRLGQPQHGSLRTLKIRDSFCPADQRNTKGTEDNDELFFSKSLHKRPSQ